MTTVYKTHQWSTVHNDNVQNPHGKITQKRPLYIYLTMYLEVVRCKFYRMSRVRHKFTYKKKKKNIPQSFRRFSALSGRYLLTALVPISLHQAPSWVKCILNCYVCRYLLCCTKICTTQSCIVIMLKHCINIYILHSF